MNQITWKHDPAQRGVHFTVQRDLVLTPTTFVLSYESLETIYAQMLAAKINAREAAKRGIVGAGQ